MLGIFAGVIVVWFIYAVGHTGKDGATDLVVLASTGAPIYIGAGGILWLSGYIEKRLDKDVT